MVSYLLIFLNLPRFLSSYSYPGKRDSPGLRQRAETATAEVLALHGVDTLFERQILTGLEGALAAGGTKTDQAPRRVGSS